jgi:hypothetical protein
MGASVWQLRGRLQLFVEDGGDKGEEVETKSAVEELEDWVVEYRHVCRVLNDY